MKTEQNATTATHTPGPWNIEYPFSEPGVYVAGPNTGLIAKLYEPDACMFNKDSKVSREANARLIAAAPELLEALKTVAEHLRLTMAEYRRHCATHGVDAIHPLDDPVMAKARAAIAKATGTEGTR
jgi:hypothetical protein